MTDGLYLVEFAEVVVGGLKDDEAAAVRSSEPYESCGEVEHTELASMIVLRSRSQTVDGEK